MDQSISLSPSGEEELEVGRGHSPGNCLHPRSQPPNFTTIINAPRQEQHHQHFAQFDKPPSPNNCCLLTFLWLRDVISKEMSKCLPSTRKLLFLSTSGGNFSGRRFFPPSNNEMSSDDITTGCQNFAFSSSDDNLTQPARQQQPVHCLSHRRLTSPVASDFGDNNNCQKHPQGSIWFINVVDYPSLLSDRSVITREKKEEIEFMTSSRRPLSYPPFTLPYTPTTLTMTMSPNKTSLSTTLDLNSLVSCFPSFLSQRYLSDQIRQDRNITTRPDEDKRRRTIILHKKDDKDSYGFTLQVSRFTCFDVLSRLPPLFL